MLKIKEISKTQVVPRCLPNNRTFTLCIMHYFSPTNFFYVAKLIIGVAFLQEIGYEIIENQLTVPRISSTKLIPQGKESS